MLRILVAAIALLGAAVVAFAVGRLLSHRRADPNANEVAVALLAGMAMASVLLVTPGVDILSLLGPLCIVAIGHVLGGAIRRSWLIWLPGVVIAAVLVSRHGVVIESVKAPFSPTFAELEPSWAMLVTVLWIVLCGGVFRSSGHSPGVALGVGGIASLGFLVVCLLQPQVTGPTAWAYASAVSGACLGALIARPTDGPGGGGLTVGFLIGVVTIMGALKNTAFLVAVLPLLLLGVPLVDATYAIVYGRKRREPAVAIEARSQRLHEVLESRGYTRRQILALFMLGSAYLTALAVVLVALIVVHFAIKMLILIVALPLGAIGLYVVAKIMPRRIDVGPEPERRAGSADRIEAWNVRLSDVTMDEALSAIDEFVRSRSPHQIVTSDASAIVRAQHDTELRRIMQEADLVTADGAGVVAMARLLDLPIRERVSGCDMVYRICDLAAERGYSLYLLGGEPGVADMAAERIAERCAGLQVAGTQHGYFRPEEEPQIIEQIKAVRPDVLLVALGIPKQEKWIRRHLQSLGVPVCIGVGGSLDVVAGKVRRAPPWVQRSGLEWLYRTVREPRRLPRLAALPAFALMTLRAALSRRAADRSPDDQ